MMRSTLAILAVLALTSSALAAPRKVLVLPLDGDADPELRAKYSASVQRFARMIDGKVTAGDVTFTDTATAIGCDPKTPQCADDVRSTLGVDELIYGTVTKEGDSVVLVVRRTAKGQDRREVSAMLEASSSPESAEAEILPLFRDTPGDSTETDLVVVDHDQKEQQDPVDTPRPAPRRATVIGYGALAGGGALVLISLALWSTASDLEEEIAAHPVNDHDDFVQLQELEDRARTRAWTGNALFLAGLALGGYGGWTLYRDRQGQHATIAPAPAPGGAAVMLRGAF
jgi:hypothetical protein